MLSTILVFLCTLVVLKQANAGAATPAVYCADILNVVDFEADVDRDFGDEPTCSGYPKYSNGPGTPLRLCGWLDGVAAEMFCWNQGDNEADLHGYDTTRIFHCIPEKAAGEGIDITEGDYVYLEDGVTDFECTSGSDRCFLECKGLDDAGVTIDAVDEIVEKCDGNPFDTAVACVDVNECRDGAIRFCTGPSHARDCDIGPACGPNTNCENSIGDYTCACIAGFTATGTAAYDITVGCTDINECYTRCMAPHRCHNMIGSYYCECAYGWVWDEVAGDCVERQCDEPEDMDYALLAGPLAPNDFGDDRTYTCEDGFEPSYRGGNSFTLSCRTDQRWCHCEPPACRRKSCSNPRYDGNAMTNKIAGVFGDSLTYTCEEGFEVEGDASYTIGCQANGKWEEPDEKCEDKDECHWVDTCSDGTYCVNTVGSFHCLCKLGYRRTTPLGPDCEKISCGAIPDVAHGERLTASSPNDDLFGSTIRYRCDEGYRVSTRNTPTQATQEFDITCTLDGTWNPFPVPECIPISCGDPGFLDYSSRKGPFFYYKREVTYKCLDGFRPSDNNGLLSSQSFNIRCQENRQWTDSAYCININECKEKDNPCGFPDEQYCIDTIGDYMCTCPPGYRLDRTGRDCEELPEEDKTNPSGTICDPFKLLGICNKGTCIYDGAGYPSCRCDPGFKGAFCDKEIGPQFTAPYIMNLCSIVLGSIVLIVCIVLMFYVCCKHLCERNHPIHDHHHDHVYGSRKPRPFPRFQLPTRMGHKIMF